MSWVRGVYKFRVLREVVKKSILQPKSLHVRSLTKPVVAVHPPRGTVKRAHSGRKCSVWNCRDICLSALGDEWPGLQRDQSIWQGWREPRAHMGVFFSFPLRLAWEYLMANFRIHTNIIDSETPNQKEPVFVTSYNTSLTIIFFKSSQTMILLKNTILKKITSLWFRSQRGYISLKNKQKAKINRESHSRVLWNSLQNIVLGIPSARALCPSPQHECCLGTGRPSWGSDTPSPGVPVALRGTVPAPAANTTTKGSTPMPGTRDAWPGYLLGPNPYSHLPWWQSVPRGNPIFTQRKTK